MEEAALIKARLEWYVVVVEARERYLRRRGQSLDPDLMGMMRVGHLTLAVPVRLPQRQVLHPLNRGDGEDGRAIGQTGPVRGRIELVLQCSPQALVA